jgi:hypothetical protein
MPRLAREGSRNSSNDSGYSRKSRNSGIASAAKRSTCA